MSVYSLLSSTSSAISYPTRKLRQYIENINAPVPDPEAFDSEWYLRDNPDVASMGINPYLHYLKVGKDEGRLPFHPQKILDNKIVLFEKEEDRSYHNESVDIVICVHNALVDVRKCIESVIEYSELGTKRKVVIVDDGSDGETQQYLQKIGMSDTIFTIHRNDTPSGYTKAVNTGIALSKGDFVLLLNSDTIVTAKWIEGILTAFKSNPTVGIVGPLSNAASWQSVPALKDPEDKFAINDIPDGCTPTEISAALPFLRQAAYPEIPLLNGFCLMVKREVFDTIGVMDEVNFPVGYGEENDFCLRAREAGFKLVLADNTYVFHAKSKSFGSDRREQLSARGQDMLISKHGVENFGRILQELKEFHAIDRLRHYLQLTNHSISTKAQYI